MNDTPPPDRSYTVDEFCQAERIGKVALYKAWNDGNGPRFYMNGKRRIIPHSARIEWQQQRMAATQAQGGADASAA